MLNIFFVSFFTTMDRYLLKMLLKHLASVTFLVVSIVWLSQSLRFLELIVNNSIGISSYISLIVFLLPDLFAILFPICLLITGAHIYQKLISDHEITVLRSTGYSNFQIAKPFLAICLSATVLILYSNIFLVPQSFQQFRSYQHRLQHKLSSSVLHPQAFNLVKGVTVYVQNRSIKGELSGILIHGESGPHAFPYTIAAEKGYLKRENDHLYLVLLKGVRHEWNIQTKQLSSCGFDNFLYDLTALTTPDKRTVIKPYERSLKELLYPDFAGSDQVIRNRMKAEAHQRLLMPFLCLANGLILMALILFGDLIRRQRKRKISIAIMTCVVFQIAVIAMINASSNVPAFIPIAYTFMGFVIFGFLGLLFYPKRSIL